MPSTWTDDLEQLATTRDIAKTVKRLKDAILELRTIQDEFEERITALEEIIAERSDRESSW